MRGIIYRFSKFALGAGMALSLAGDRAMLGYPSAVQANSERLSFQAKLEQLAARAHYFSREVFLSNRPEFLEREFSAGHLGGVHYETPPLVLEQTKLVTELTALSRDRERLVVLLTHPDPKVRALVLGALFLRQDGRDLPLIAYLLHDAAATLPDLHPTMYSAPIDNPLPHMESPQTVGELARRMLQRYHMIPSDTEIKVEKNTGPDFASRWKSYEGRTFAASWMQEKMERASRRYLSVVPKYRVDIDAVIADIDALPAPDRDWTRLYVLCPQHNIGHRDAFMQDAELIATARRLGPAALMMYLQHKPVSSDPDLPGHFWSMSHFILLNADKLLRMSDSEALLACEATESSEDGVSPLWRIAVALLQPSRAAEVLKPALEAENRYSYDAEGQLAGYLWRTSGLKEKQYLTEWFLQTLSKPRALDNYPDSFLRKVREVGLSGTNELIAGLVQDSRFDRSGWEVLREVLEIANDGRPEPIVNSETMYRASRNSVDSAILKEWRHLLREAYRVR